MVSGPPIAGQWPAVGAPAQAFRVARSRRLAHVEISHKDSSFCKRNFGFRYKIFRLAPMAFVDFFPDGAPADVGVAEGGSVIAQEGVSRFHEQDLVHELFHPTGLL